MTRGTVVIENRQVIFTRNGENKPALMMEISDEATKGLRGLSSDGKDALSKQVAAIVSVLDEVVEAMIGAPDMAPLIAKESAAAYRFIHQAAAKPTALGLIVIADSADTDSFGLGDEPTLH